MPRPKRVDQVTTALVASARRYSGKTPVIHAPTKNWQERAYHHYGHIGEARFAARYFGHSLSRADIFVADVEGQRLESGPAVDHLFALFDNAGGKTETLEDIGTHLTVGGECYLIGRKGDDGDRWEIFSTLEVQSGSAGWRIKEPEDGQWVALEETDTVIRIWIPMPGAKWEADSPFRSLLPVLDEVEWLSRYIHAQMISRLTGAGILFLPDGITFPPPPPVDGKETAFANEADGFMMTLGEDMLEAIKDPSSPAATVPLVATVPGDYIDKIQHVTFWTELDEHAREMRQDAIMRFALGMDIPPEMVLGMSSNEGTGGGTSNGVSHWGAWQLEEQAIKLHIEPMLDVVTHALKHDFLRHLDEGFTGTVKSDTSALRLRPDRSKEAGELYDRGELAAATLLTETGFDPENDSPDDEERRKWLLRRVATGSASPEQVGAALRLLGADLGIEVQGDKAAPETPQPPSLEDHPTRPRTPAESSLVPVYEALVLRALERAGNRLRNVHNAKTPGSSYEAHTYLAANGATARCLDDAWATAPQVLEGVVDSPDSVIGQLNGYCTALMVNQKPHSREALAEWCKKAGI